MSKIKTHSPNPISNITFPFLASPTASQALARPWPQPRAEVPDDCRSSDFPLSQNVAAAAAATWHVCVHELKRKNNLLSSMSQTQCISPARFCMHCSSISSVCVCVLAVLALQCDWLTCHPSGGQCQCDWWTCHPSGAQYDKFPWNLPWCGGWLLQAAAAAPWAF